MENYIYNAPVMAGRPAQKQAPPFGQRLSAFRRSKGLTQAELAERLGITQKLMEYYERRAPNPTLSFVERAAKALGISVAELLGTEYKSARRKPGPSSQIEKKLERIKLLPPRDQETLMRTIDAFLRGFGV